MNVTLEKPQPKVTPEPDFWNGPLGYLHAILVVLAAFLVGLFYHWRMPHGLHVPAPVALGVVLSGTIVVVFASLRWRGDRVMDWLTGVPFAIVSTVAMCLVAGVGAVVPAETVKAKFHMDSVYSSWPFAMVVLTMMVNLIGISARRLYPFSYRNLCFTLNHLGLAVAILGGAISAAGLQRASLVLHEGQPNAIAMTDADKPVQLPFSATLQKFHLESFPPVVAVADEDATAEDGIRVTPGTRFVKPGMKETVGGLTIQVADYYPLAAPVAGVWKPAPGMKVAAPAARVVVTDSLGHKAGEGWISSGSPAVEQAFLQIPNNRAVFMPEPRPREFRSTVTIEQNGAAQTREVRVNQPVSVAGYRLYQISYDDTMGAASKVSVIEIVRDRGLPIVYAGLYLMIAGAALMLWNGVGKGATVEAAGTAGANSQPSNRKTLLLLDGLMLLAVGAGIAYIAWLWITLQRPPLRTLGETRWWYAVLVPAIGILIGWRFRTRALAVPSLLMGGAFAVINLQHPEYMDKTLMPALQSPWFVPHVVVYMLAYSALGLSSLIGAWAFVKRMINNQAVRTTDVDLPHRLVMVGFPLLSCGLIFGALWAKEAWGHYWSWDPKETWAFLTWAAYLVYFHVKGKHSMQPKLNLGLLVVGFGVLMMCWFGVNKLPTAQQSVHTYSGRS